MDDASSGSDDGHSRGNEWEVVTRSLSSHSLSASTSFGTVTGADEMSKEWWQLVAAIHDDSDGLILCDRQSQGTGTDTGGGATNSTMRSDYFLCNPNSPTRSLNRVPSEEASEVVSKGELGGPPEVPSGAVEKAAPAVEKESTKGGEPDLGGRGGKSSSCASQMHELSGMDWMEPMVPGLGHSVDYEQDEIGSASILYALAPETKGGMEPDFGQAGPLLGSCLSSPSSPAIVSRANSLRLGSGDELFPSQVIDGDASSERGCSVEEEVHSLAGLEREILGADSGFEFPDSGAGLERRKLELDDRGDSDPLLGDGCDDHTCEAWWKKRAALWCVQARQANTLWSLALAAAVMGLVILGHRWQHERCQNQQLRLQLCSKDEKISQLIFQVARLKEALSGRRRVPVLRTSSAYSSFRDRF